MVSSSSTVAGDNVTLTCSLTPSGRVTSTPDFNWEGPGVIDSTNITERVFSQLLLTEIATSQAGVYSCIVIYRQVSFSTDTTLTVQSKFSSYS